MMAAHKEVNAQLNADSMHDVAHEEVNSTFRKENDSTGLLHFEGNLYILHIHAHIDEG